MTDIEKKKQKEIADQLESEYSTNSKGHLSMLQGHWNTRTNDPYKNIIKDDKYYAKFLKENLVRGKRISLIEKQKLENELIVHKVTSADKHGVTEKYGEYRMDWKNTIMNSKLFIHQINKPNMPRNLNIIIGTDLGLNIIHQIITN